WKRKEVQDLFEKMNVLTREEVNARYDIELENYARRRDIEARICADLAQNHIIPTVISYQSRIIENLLGLKEILSAAEAKEAGRTQLALIRDISTHLNGLKDNLDSLRKELDKAHKLEGEKHAEAYCHKIKPLMDAIRDHADALELMVDDEMWPLPKMREILWTR
ncbi:MAG: hypothetical protein RL220_451, partial [Bacteroidota bacterium]